MKKGTKIIRKIWTDEEVTKLRKIYYKHSLVDLSAIFDRSPSTIQHKASSLGMFRYHRCGGKITQEKKRRALERERELAKGERSKYGCMPNALIFLEENWREKAWAEHRQERGRTRVHHWGTFVVGKGYDE